MDLTCSSKARDMYYSMLNIMPENQTVKTEMIKLYSELYDKKYITAEMLAKEILGTCSIKEVNELVEFITGKEAEKQAQEQAAAMQQQLLNPMNAKGEGNEIARTNN